MWRFARVILGMTLRKAARPGWKEWLADGFTAFLAIYSHRPGFKCRSMKHCVIIAGHVCLEHGGCAGKDTLGFISRGLATIIEICGHSRWSGIQKNIPGAYCR